MKILIQPLDTSGRTSATMTALAVRQQTLTLKYVGRGAGGGGGGREKKKKEEEEQEEEEAEEEEKEEEEEGEKEEKKEEETMPRVRSSR